MGLSAGERCIGGGVGIGGTLEADGTVVVLVGRALLGASKLIVV